MIIDFNIGGFNDWEIIVVSNNIIFAFYNF